MASSPRVVGGADAGASSCLRFFPMSSEDTCTFQYYGGGYVRFIVVTTAVSYASFALERMKNRAAFWITGMENGDRNGNVLIRLAIPYAVYVCSMRGCLL